MTPKFALLAFLTLGVVGVGAQELLEERVVLQTSMGNIELASSPTWATRSAILENSSAATTTPTTSASTADSSRRLRP